MKKFFTTILLFTICFGFFSGCHPKKESKQTSFFEWTDAYNRPIHLDKEPSRIISLSPAITEIIYLIDAQEKLVAVSDFCDYPADAQKLPKVGGMQNINMEALLSLHPDVVLIGSIVSKKDVSTLERMNVPVVTIKEESTIEGMATLIETIGKITNHSQTADIQSKQWKERITKIKSSNINHDTSSKSIYYVVGFGDAGDFTAPKGSHIHEIIELAGGHNIGAELNNWNISREYLFQENPDIIIIRKEDYETFCHTHPYDRLEAVKKGSVFPIESGWIDIVSPRNLKAIEYLHEIICE